MSTAKAIAASLLLALGGATALASDLPGLGKPVSEADLAVWDISVGPDGKGLPAGSGTPQQGSAIFAQKCAGCHGEGGVGGSNASLINAPGKTERTMALYVPYATTIFDFTRRAMPWPQPSRCRTTRPTAAHGLHPRRQQAHRRQRHDERRDIIQGAHAEPGRREPVPGETPDQVRLRAVERSVVPHEITNE